jgi:dipeptidyl aminopeptidase/acylaminoacyl peptidase
MQSNIIHREEIKLGQSHARMVISGWSEEAYANTIVEKITYLSDGLRVKGYIAYPKDSGNKKLPCIIWNRGGYENRGAIDKFTAKGIFGNIASWGYVVFASQYRGNDGGEGEEQLGGKDVNDVLNLIPLADEFSFTDNTKWGIEGWSRGGMMTYLTLMQNPDFKCAILSGAITDVISYSQKSERFFPALKAQLGEELYNAALEDRNIITKANQLPDIPYLLLHGGKDDTVPVIQTLDMARKFYEMNYNYRLVIFEDGDHYLKSYRKEVDALRKMWFDKYLQKM